MSPVNRTGRGALSWQQSGRLRRDSLRGERVPNPTTALSLHPAVTLEEVRKQAAELIDREDVLRIVEVSGGDGGYVEYADSLDPPIAQIQVSSREALQETIARMTFHRFPRAGGPLWDMALVEHPDPAGRPARTLCATFDHLISDGRSMHLFRSQIGSTRSNPLGRRGTYPRWVTWQRDQFPEDAGVETAAASFWRGYLDGVRADTAPALPFCTSPAGPLTGSVRTLFMDLGATKAMLQSAAARLKVSPFILILATTAVTVARMAGVGDVSFRVNTTGRPAEFVNTLGWFASCIPVRIRDDDLSDPARALSASRSSWLRTLAFQATPWDYITAICGQDDSVLTGRPPFMDVNFIPEEVIEIPPSSGGEMTHAGELGTLQLNVGAVGEDRYLLGCQFDPGRFDTQGARAFLGSLVDALGQLVDA